MDIERLKKHKFIVIGYEHYNPLGVIRSLGENGIHPIVVMLKSDVKIASKSKYIGKLYYVDSNEEAYTLLLREYGNEKVKPFVIPCDDNITELFDHKYAEVKDKFYVANAGEADRISHYMNKYVLRRSAIPFYGLFVLFFFSLFISGIIKQPFAFNEYSSLIFMPLMVWSLIECWKILKSRNK